MSRVIKFRCWNAFANHMHDWNEMVEKNKIHLLSNENNSYICEQFTGLTDKNGVEIYEGDVLSGISKVFMVVVGDVCISEYLDCEEYMHGKHFGWNVTGIPLVDLINDGLVVIGNIHQNPELIK